LAGCVRDVGRLMIEFLRDLKFSCRSLRRSPGFTLTTIAALALGIGANTGIFSVVNAVLLQPLSYPEPDRIVQFMLASPAGPGAGGSAAEFNIWRRQNDTFQDISAYRNGAMTLTGSSYPEQIASVEATAATLRLFGAPLERGRGFAEGEDRPNSRRVVVITDELWRRDFGADPGLLGKTISLDRAPYVVIGILAPGFGFDSDPRPDVWTPLAIDPESNDHAHYFVAAGRLKPGITLAAANARMQLAYAEFRRKYPNYVGPGNGFSVEPIRDRFVSDVRPALLVLLGAVGMVLLIACANVASLLTVRAIGRAREFAVRAALGAGRGRLIRQLLTECLLLSLAGGALGLAASAFGVRFLLAINPGDIPRIGPHGSAVGVDAGVLSFTILVSIGTAALFGLMPAIQASRANLDETLRESGGRAAGGRRQNRTRSLLVISETALAAVLLIGAALLVRSFTALREVNPGFDPHQVLTFRTSLSGTPFNRTRAVAQLVHDGVERIATLPGVAAAAAATALPLEGSSGLPFDIADSPLAGGPVRVGWTAISSDYFAALRVPIVRGRALTERDGAGAPPVVIMNQAMARRFWPDGNPIGARLLIGRNYAPGFDEPPREVVGVVGDIHDEGLNRNPGPMLYVPLPQVPEGITALFSRVLPLAWVVRTRVEPHALIAPVENQLRGVSRDLPVAEVRTMDEISVRSTSRQTFNAVLMTIFGAAALLLAALGVYGLMASSVAQRRHEIGIRLALGADSRTVRTMIVWQGLRLAFTGIALGVAAAFPLVRLLQGLLFGIRPHDVVTFTAVPIILAALALFAVWFPAIQATRVDAARALRSE
jgi:putative ABC transport system permease protein